MNADIDERDVEILLAIATEQSPSTETIHEATGIPKSTVHYRLNSLREDGVIANDLFELDLEQVGLEITIISEVWAEFDQGYHDRVGRTLSEIEGVNQVYFTMGDTDFVVIARLSSRDTVVDLVEEYESVDEITRTSSKFVITAIKDQTPIGLLADYEKETLLEAHGIEADVSAE
ncbi:Lrp/AsnC family transcriptional regulator [Natrononativus amylolyticus]|uniref:Lrp/AsnC family transcriptional regulator n=1 Tax=Natrononativus amylolyticus TaxID=2963434 RepID=UPI0020CD326C|nr:Lrp/AsnC family transcriptional regulator [Natrononativus amylolyticus]